MAHNPVTNRDIAAIIRRLDAVPQLTPEEASQTAEIEREFADYFKDKEFNAAVLGIDIYRYSKYRTDKQRLIPSLFAWLQRVAVEKCREAEGFLFQREQFASRFISTGDGGFFIFDTPLHALAYAVWFQAAVTVFNGFSFTPKMRAFLGPLTLRYTLTYDQVFQADGDWYGSAIINNARVLSRDTLNRFLLDGNSVEWFASRFRSLETLRTFKNPDLMKVPELKDYDAALLKSSMLISADRTGKSSKDNNLDTLVVQHIGEIEAKGERINLCSLYLQLSTRFSLGPKPPTEPLVIALGNLNSTGLSVT